MTIDVPVDSPKGNILCIDLTESFIGTTDEKEISSNLSTLEPNKIPVVILKKLSDDDKYYVVSPRSSNRIKTIKNYQGFEMDLSEPNLKGIERESASPKKRGRLRKNEVDVGMISPTKIQKTQKKTYSKNDNNENNINNLCTSLKDAVRLTTPVKRSLNKTDFSDGESMENSPSPRKKGVQEGVRGVQEGIKDTPKRDRGRPRQTVSCSPVKTDENRLALSEKRESQSPQKLQVTSPLKSVKINLDESFRRTVLKSTVNLDNVRRESNVQNGRITRRSVAKQDTPTKSCGRRRAPKSYTSFFYYESDSDDTEEKMLERRNDKVASAKRMILRSRNNSISSVDLPLENESETDKDKSTKSQRRRLKSESDSENSLSGLENDHISPKIVHPKTPSRRKQVLKPRKDSISDSSEKSDLSPKRKQPNDVSNTPRSCRGKKNSVLAKALDVSPERRSRREVAKTPRTPRTRDVAAATPKSVKATPKTPKNRLKLLRDGVITPSMHSRSSIVPGDSTPLMKARSQLHVSYVPTSLPCREREYLDVYNFLKGKLEDDCGGCMYISGVPGTGKTATVTSVIDSLQNDKKVPKFSYVSVNGMRLTEPRQSYVEIWKQLTGKTVPWEQAQSLLEERFTKKKNLSPVVMLIDELDILCTKRQDVVYNLLDWPAKSKDQLIVITIANTMDLPERLLMSRVTSRLGLTRLTFQAYTHKQLMEIVTKRLTGTNSFNPDAVQLVARKVASVSGDARRALDICRRAAEIAEDEGKGQLVNIMHINEALNAMITQPQVMAIRRCSRLQRLLLQAIVAEIERTGVEETTFSEVFRILVSCCALDGFNMVSSTVAQRAICELSAYRLIITDQKCSNIFQRIILNVSVHDVYFALKRE